MNKHIILQCTCGDHDFLEVDIWPEQSNYPADATVTIGKKRGRWFRRQENRFKDIWHIVRGTAVYTSESVVLTNEQAVKLARDILKVLDD